MADNNTNNKLELASSLDKKYDELLDKAYIDLKNDNSTDVVNIITSYPWTLNQHPTNNIIPCGYITEYRQNISSFNATLSWLEGGVYDAIADSPNIIQNNNELFASLTKHLKAFGNFVQDKTTPNKENDFNTSINNPILSPYMNMYSCSKEKCNKYVFPYISNNYNSITNSFSESPDQGSYINSTLHNVVGSVGNYSGLLGDLGNLGTLLADNNMSLSDRGIYIEKPKYFNYTGQGESVTFRFQLYNGDINNRIDIWKTNYRFIKNFIFKNLPFKISVFRYKTPTLYNVVIPGIAYLPLSYVSSIICQSIGMSRMLTYDNNKLLVPDAWSVSIKFQSLMAPSANTYYIAANNKITIDGIN